LLLADDSNPRALAFQIVALADHIANLPREAGRARGNEARQMDTLRGLLGGANWLKLVETQFAGQDPAVNTLLARIVAELRGLSDSINQQYFSHATTQVS